MNEFIQPMGKIMFIRSCSLSAALHTSAGYSINRGLRGKESVSFRKRSEFVPKEKTGNTRRARCVASENNEALIKIFEELDFWGQTT